MKVNDIIGNKEDNTIKVKIHANKRKRKHNKDSETDPKSPEVFDNYGMADSIGMDAVIQH